MRRRARYAARAANGDAGKRSHGDHLGGPHFDPGTVHYDAGR
jgi:hypothetical protein